VRFPDIGYSRLLARRVVREALRDRKAVLEAVADEDVSVELAAAYRDSYRWLAGRGALDRRTEVVFEAAQGMLMFGSLGVIGWLISRRTEPDYVSWGCYVAGWFGGGLAFTGFARLVARLPSKLQNFVFLSILTGVLAGCSLLWREAGSATALLDVIAANWWYVGLTGAVVMPASLLIGFMPAFLVIGWFQDRADNRRAPRTALLARLFELTRALMDPRALTENKEYLLTTVREAGAVLEYGFWREVRLVDPVSRAIWRDRCRQCAERLRSFDLWIVLPRRETRDDLLAEVTTLIQVLVRGCLDELPTADPRPQRKLAVVGSKARGLLLGLMPLSLVLAAWSLGLNLSGPIGGAWVVASVAWFALTLLTTFDSQAANRISLLKDAAEATASFRGGKP
jgi:hypothetical protein